LDVDEFKSLEQADYAARLSKVSPWLDDETRRAKLRDRAELIGVLAESMEEAVQLELQEDGTFKFLKSHYQEEPFFGKWSISNGTIRLDYDERGRDRLGRFDLLDGTYDGTRIVLGMSGARSLPLIRKTAVPPKSEDD